MENAQDADDEYTTQSTTYCPEAGHGNGMFSSSHHFTVTSQSLTNITKNITKNYTAAPSVPSNVRMIPLGDIDLQHEIRVNNYTGEVDWWQGRQGRVRRIYSARIESRKSSATVAMYQGDGAEEEWRQDVATYMTVCHPNIIQIAGVATSGGIHATVFTDDPIPFETFLDVHQGSHSFTVLLFARCGWDFNALNDYFCSTYEREWRPGYDCTEWIRSSTGRFCAELGNTTQTWILIPTPITNLQNIHALSLTNTDTVISELLTLRDYHEICFRNLSQLRSTTHSNSTMEITLEVILSGASGHPLEDPVEIALLANPEGHLSPWYGSRGDTHIMGNGWTRLNSHDVWEKLSLGMFMPYMDSDAWLSQATCIFHRLGIVSNFENYVVVDEILFHLSFSPSDEDTPPGFLFLCPEEEFRTGPASFRWPDPPAYWSLNPFGTDSLSAKEAIQLGFPTFQLTTEVYEKSWNASVYDGIRKFHRAKGFDPESQDVALHLGHRLYRLSSEVNKEDYWDGVYGCHQSGDYLRALFAKNMDNDDTSSSPEETHELGTINWGPDPTEASNCQNSHRDHISEVSALDLSVGQRNFGSHTLDEEVSATFKVWFNVQLTLILFLGMSWLYEQM